MKKTTRILALAGAVILLLLYVCTLVFAIIGTDFANQLLKASIAATILLPVLLYGCILFYRMGHKNTEDETEK